MAKEKVAISDTRCQVSRCPSAMMSSARIATMRAHRIAVKTKFRSVECFQRRKNGITCSG